tara:strand:+ start:564 stop:1130 length:567 start_codon:yes stop_codon:yes gene_type:complete
MGEDIFSDRLLKGERILWAGKPAAGILFTSRDIFTVPFSLLWCGFAIFWTFMASAGGKSPAFFPLFGLLFVAIGLFFVFGRFFADAWIRSRTHYAVTDQRVLILRSIVSKNFSALNLSQLQQVNLNETSGGRGSVRLGPQISMFSRNSGNLGSWMPSMDPTPQLLAIDNVRQVFDLIQSRSGRAGQST